MLLLLAPLRPQLSKLGHWYWIFFSYNLLLLLTSLTALLLLDSDKSSGALQNRLSAVLKRFSVFFGNGRWLFRALFLLTLFFYVDSQSRQFLVLAVYAAVILLIDPKRFVLQSWMSARGSGLEIGEIIGVQSRNVFLAKLYKERLLNPLIRGWANYHRCAVAGKPFHGLSWQIWRTLWQWAKRRHPNKGGRWIASRYWTTAAPRWAFAARGQRREVVKLVDISGISIRRHVKIRAGANPYDPNWEMSRQDGRCPVCSQLITTDTDWHTHHIVWRVKGDSDRLDNLALLHPDCHRQVHSSKLAVA
jgi:hypothetical protein